MYINIKDIIIYVVLQLCPSQLCPSQCKHRCPSLIAAQFSEEIEELSSRFPNTSPVQVSVDAEFSEHLEALIASHDLTVSLLPYTLHARIAESCIKHGKDMVTASYRSPAMFDLHEKLVNSQY